MKKESATVVLHKAHYLKGHASWLYCDKDESPLFSPVMKNIESYVADAVCKECNTRFHIEDSR